MGIIHARGENPRSPASSDTSWFRLYLTAIFETSGFTIFRAITFPFSTFKLFDSYGMAVKSFVKCSVFVFSLDMLFMLDVSCLTPPRLAFQLFAGQAI